MAAQSNHWNDDDDSNDDDSPWLASGKMADVPEITESEASPGSESSTLPAADLNSAKVRKNAKKNRPGSVSNLHCLLPTLTLQRVRKNAKKARLSI